MTSNAGSNLNNNSIGFGNKENKDRQKLENTLKETFRPEFLNRIDEIVIFNSLTPEQLLQIVDIMLADTQKALDDKNITLTIDYASKEFLMQKGTDLKFGARPLRRAIQRYLEDEISEMILRSELQNGQTIHVTFDHNQNKLQFTAES